MTLNTAPNGVGNLWAYSLVSLKDMIRNQRGRDVRFIDPVLPPMPPGQYCTTGYIGEIPYREVGVPNFNLRRFDVFFVRGGTASEPMKDATDAAE